MKICPKCKMQIRDEDKICQFCGAAQMTNDSPMKKYEEEKAKRKEQMTPERKRSKRQETFVLFTNFILIVGFIAAISFIIYIFFKPELMEMIEHIKNYIRNLINR